MLFRCVELTRVGWSEVDLTELVHHLYLAGAFMRAVIVSHQYQPFTSVFGPDVILDVRHELDDAAALGGLVYLKVAIYFQAM